jgi:hypothetical protein
MTRRKVQDDAVPPEKLDPGDDDRGAPDHVVREQAMLTGKLAPGLVRYEMLHALSQFSTWPLAALYQKLAREHFEGLGIWGVGALAGLSMIGGYIRMTARDLAYGDQPRTPRSVGDAFKVGGAALAQGGGLGLLGDWLFGEIDRLGAGNAGIGGPMATDLSKLNEIRNRATAQALAGKPTDVWPELARFGMNHIPFANLFYTKAAFDYLLAYHMYEALKPGWYQRTNEAMKRQQGRTMIGYKGPGPSIPYILPQLGAVLGR